MVNANCCHTTSKDLLPCGKNLKLLIRKNFTGRLGSEPTSYWLLVERSTTTVSNALIIKFRKSNLLEMSSTSYRSRSFFYQIYPLPMLWSVHKKMKKKTKEDDEEENSNKQTLHKILISVKKRVALPIRNVWNKTFSWIQNSCNRWMNWFCHIVNKAMTDLWNEP